MRKAWAISAVIGATLAFGTAATGQTADGVTTDGVTADEIPRVALVIGNSAYEKTGWTLGNTANDARDVGAALQEVGFDVSVVLDATEDEMEAAAQQFRRRLRSAGEAAVGLFYFAGHGISVNSFNYLVPIDADAYTQEDMVTEAVRLGTILDFMNQAGNATNFVILDACRDTPLPSATRSSGGGLSQPTKSRGFLISYSTAPGATAADGDGANSPYSAALVDLIRVPGISAEEMFKRVAGRVEADTNLAQSPFFESGLRGADFCFAGCGPVEADPEADADWASVRDTRDVRLLQDFIEKHPRSRHARTASLTIENLQGGGRSPALDARSTGASDWSPPWADVAAVLAGLEGKWRPENGSPRAVVDVVFKADARVLDIREPEIRTLYTFNESSEFEMETQDRAMGMVTGEADGRVTGLSAPTAEGAVELVQRYEERGLYGDTFKRRRALVIAPDSLTVTTWEVRAELDPTGAEQADAFTRELERRSFVRIPPADGT